MALNALERALSALDRAPVHRPSGVVLDVVGLVVEIGGLRAAVGDTLDVLSEAGERLAVEVVGFRSGRVLATPLGPLKGIRAGAVVTTSARGSEIPVGNQLLGRVVDPFGVPLDGLPAFETDEQVPIHAAPPPPFARKPVNQPFSTGVRVIDGLLTLGIGQRVGIFAGAGVGKSTLLGMICRSSAADVNVVGLVGERGRELNDFIRNTLGPEGLKRSVVVAATSDQPPLVRARGADAATAIAEHFRDQGKSVLLVMDSVTRYAMALRESALAAGEPPATKGYPPSVFAALPRLLERAGTAAGAGVITALYTVFVEGDDLSDPVADAVMGILDGHIVLSRQLAGKGHFPAVDVLQSVSRLAAEVAPAEVLQAASRVRDALGTYRDALDLIQVGAYTPGTDPRVDHAVGAMPRIDAFVKQAIGEPTRPEETRARLVSLNTPLSIHPGNRR
jgi:flagellum-specific ATP synthase